MDEELVRCRPCGYVMKASELGDVCPACGLPRSVFEPYRERVSPNRLFILSLDIHPIAIHLSQTFVALTPMLMIFHLIFPNFEAQIILAVIQFSVFALPFSLILSFLSGLLDGITRFKTLRTPMLKSKIIFSSLIIILSALQLIFFKPATYNWLSILIGIAALACAVRLGLLGKHLLDVILPGTYVPRKKKKTAPKPKPIVSKQQTENYKIFRL
jgi:rubredoxin